MRRWAYWATWRILRQSSLDVIFPNYAWVKISTQPAPVGTVNLPFLASVTYSCSQPIPETHTVAAPPAPKCTYPLPFGISRWLRWAMTHSAIRYRLTAQSLSLGFRHPPWKDQSQNVDRTKNHGGIGDATK